MNTMSSLKEFPLIIKERKAGKQIKWKNLDQMWYIVDDK